MPYKNLIFDINELFEACVRVREEFAPPGRSFKKRELYAAEARRRKEIEIIINHLATMAQVLLEEKSSFNSFSGDAYEEIHTTSKNLITPLCMRRRDNGPLRFVYAISSFFNKNNSPDPIEMFYYLRGIVGILYSNFNRKTKKFNNPAYVKTQNNVDAYIRKSKRYIKKQSFIIDSSVSFEAHEAVIPQGDDILSLCGRFNPIPKNVPSAVDKIFNLLAESTEFKSRVQRETLVAAVKKLQKPQGIEHSGIPFQPFSIYLRKEFTKISLGVAEELRESYRWRKQFSKEEKEGMFKAVEDYLLDLGLKKPDSLYKYLALHIGNCTRSGFESNYKGSFQNLKSNAYERWLDKVRCIPGLIYHIIR